MIDGLLKRTQKMLGILNYDNCMYLMYSAWMTYYIITRVHSQNIRFTQG